MAVPQRRTSKTRKRLRRTHFKLSVTGLVTCSNCGKLIKSHTVCPHCGFYKGEQVITGKDTPATKPVVEAKKTEKATTKKATTKKATTKKVEASKPVVTNVEKKTTRKSTTRKAPKQGE